jgi:hypothetical protein
LSHITGTVYRGTELISSNVLLNLMQVGCEPVLQQKVGTKTLSPGAGIAPAFPPVGPAGARERVRRQRT